MEGFDVCCLLVALFGLDSHTRWSWSILWNQGLSKHTAALYDFDKVTLLPLSIWSFCKSTNRKLVLAREKIYFSDVVLLTEVAVYPWCLILQLHVIYDCNQTLHCLWNSTCPNNLQILLKVGNQWNKLSFFLLPDDCLITCLKMLTSLVHLPMTGCKDWDMKVGFVQHGNVTAYSRKNQIQRTVWIWLKVFCEIDIAFGYL